MICVAMSNLLMITNIPLFERYLLGVSGLSFVQLSYNCIAQALHCVL